MDCTDVDAIEAWFAMHRGQGEFEFGEYLATENISGTVEKVVYTTKRHSVAHAMRIAPLPGIAMLGMNGLPTAKLFRKIQIQTVDRDVYFLGDMDPVDLLIFTWLSHHLARRTITYFGISDHYLSTLGVKVPDSYRISLSPDESASIPLLERVVPELRGLIGEGCADLLHEGLKIEVEAVVSACGSAARLLAPIKN